MTNVYGIVYSPNKYRETEGIKDLFNQSHSFSYAVNTFQTAYLKQKYPIHFFKALFNMHKDKAGMLNKYILDAKAFNVRVFPPNINSSGVNFSINETGVLFGFSAISGIGETLSTKIVEEREKNGRFKNFKDLQQRCNLKKAQVIALIKSGAIPTSSKRKALENYLKTLYEPREFKIVSTLKPYAVMRLEWDIDCEKYRIDPSKKVYDKQKMLEDYNNKRREIFNQEEQERKRKYMNDNLRYLDDEEFWEFQTLQIFIDNNPFSNAEQYLKNSFEDAQEKDTCVVYGVLSRVQKKKDKNKNTYAFANLYSPFGLIEVLIWSSTFSAHEDLIKKGVKVTMICTKENEEKVICQDIRDYDDWFDYVKNRRM